MKKILFFILLSYISNSYSQAEITKTVVVDALGWKRVAQFDGAYGRGYNEITLMTTGGASEPRVAKISWFKGWSNYGGLNIESVSDDGHWSDVRMTYDGNKAYLEVNFTSTIPQLKVYLNQSAWIGGDILEGTLPNGGDTVILSAKFGRLNYGEDDFFLAYDGKIGIGTNTPDSKLTIAGNIHAQEVKVTINAGADFVFKDNYNLPDLEKLEAFVKTNKHLPEIASEKEMRENGVLLAEMNIKLLQKIEELTLYTIEQEKEIQSQKKESKEKSLEVQELNEKLNLQENRLQKIEQLLKITKR